MSPSVPESAGDGSWLLEILAGLGGYTLLVVASPALRYFRDGLKVVRRYPRIWIWFAALATGYFAFQIGQAILAGEIPVNLSSFFMWPSIRPLNWPQGAARAWLPALESVAGIFNQSVVTYPASALAAVLFLVNWRGFHGRLAGEMRSRLAHWWIPVYAGVLLCSLAAIAKPLLVICVQWLNQSFDGILLLRAGAVLDWLSFQFETLFGVAVQIYVILLALVWVRGLSASSARVFGMALRRTAHVLKWSGIILLLNFFFIHLPLLVSYFWIGQFTDFTSAVVLYIEQTARPLLALATIMFCSVQITLALHNLPLSAAIVEHADTARRHWYRLAWFLTFAGIHFFAVCWISETFLNSLSTGTIIQVICLLLSAVVKTGMAAWFLAAWVCFYRETSRPRKELRIN